MSGAPPGPDPRACWHPTLQRSTEWWVKGGGERGHNRLILGNVNGNTANTANIGSNR